MFDIKIYDLGHCEDSELTRVVKINMFLHLIKKETDGKYQVVILKKEKHGKKQLNEKCMKKQVLQK